MTLNQCTKEELIYIIKRAIGKHSFSEEQRQAEISSHLSDIKLQRSRKILKEADNWNKIAADNRQKYYDLLIGYKDTKLIDIPTDIIKQAETALKDAQFADKKWHECMRKVDSYYGDFEQS